MSFAMIFIIFFISLLFESSLAQCDVPNLEIHIPPTIKLFEKAAVSVTHGYVPGFCSTAVKYKWELLLMAGKETLIERVFEVNNVHTKENILDLSKADKKTPFYKYELKIKASFVPAEWYRPTSSEKRFRVTPEKLKLLIKGGNETEHIFGYDDLYINASESTDPANWRSVHPITQNIITWSCSPRIPSFPTDTSGLVLKLNDGLLRDFEAIQCRMTVTRVGTPFFRERAFVSQLIKIKFEPAPTVKVKCLSNCGPPSNPFEDTVLEGICVRGCKPYQARWSMIPLNTSLYSFMTSADTPENHTLTVKKGAFSPGSSITFSFNFGTGSANYSTSFIVRNPNLSLFCKENCKYDVDFPVVFEVQCSGGEDDCVDIRYRWETSPIFNFKLNENGTRLTIPEDTLKKDQLLQVETFAWKSNATIKAIMKEFIPALKMVCFEPTKGNCPKVVDPRREIKLKVNCVNCDRVLTYAIEPMPHKKEKIIITEFLLILARAYANHDIVNITAKTGKYNITHTFQFIVEPAKFHIECEANCGRRANSFKDTIVSAKCTEKCDFLDFKWEIPQVDQALVDSWKTQGGTKLLIPTQTFHDDQNVSIILINDLAKVSREILYKEPPAEISILCLSNCLQTDPLEETELQVICMSEHSICPLMDYTWRFDPLPNNFNFKEKIEYEDSSKSKIKIKQNAFKDNDTIVVSVSGRKSKAEMKFLFREHIPELSLKCTEACDPSHPGYDAIFKVNCEVNCNRISYVWNVTGAPKNFDAFTSLIFSDDKTTMTIKAGTFKGGDKIGVQVTSGKASAKLPVNFIVMPPLLQITCSLPCNETHNPLTSLSLWVNCTKYCYVSTFNFTWKFKNQPKGFDYNKFVITQKNNEAILILAEAFNNGSSVTVQVLTDSSNTSQVLNYLEPTVVLDILCEDYDNCTNLSIFRPVTLLSVCVTQCDFVKSFYWKLKPPPPNWASNVTSTPFNKSIVLGAEIYKEGMDVEVTLSVRKFNVTRILNFAEFLPKIALHCWLTCSSANPFEDVTIEVKCIENCEKPVYMWDIQMVDKNFSFSNSIVITDRNRTLTIKNGTFYDTKTIMVIVTNRKAKTEQAIHFLEPISTLLITCVHNCENDTANPLEEVILRVTCVDYCYRNNFTWIPKPPPAKENWQSGIIFGDRNITILKGMYRDKGSVRLVVVNGKGQASQDLYFEEPTPEISLICPDCLQPNPDKDLNFYVHCDTCKFYNYTWEITPQLRDFSWKQDVGFGMNNESMVIASHTFKNKENVTVIVVNGKGKAMIDFTYEYPPRVIKISCVQNCLTANPFQKVVLNVTCQYDCEESYYEWKMKPLSETFNWYKNVLLSEENQVLTIVQDSFVASDNITITAFQINDALQDSVTVRFVEFEPDIELKCKENCVFNPKRELVLEVTCKSHCEHLTYEWEVTPQSRILDFSETHGQQFHIKPKSYDDKDILNISVKVLSVKRNMTMTFSLPDYEGNCFIEPNSGVAGVTEFNIDCEEFLIGVEYWLYQNYTHNKRDHGVLVAFSRTKYLEGFMLSESEGFPLTLTVGNDWKSKKELNITVQVSPYDKNIKSLNEIILGTGDRDFAGLIEGAEYLKAFQLASALGTALKSENEITRHHYLRHIISGLIKIAPHLEPLQLISLLEKLFVINFDGDPLNASLLMKGGRVLSNMVLEDKGTILYPAAIASFAEDLAWLSSHVLYQMHEKAEALNNSDISPDYPLYTDFSLPNADIKRHIQAATLDLLYTINIITEIIPKANKNRIKSDTITINAKRPVLADTKNLKTPGAKSYISLPNTFFEVMYDKETPLYYKLVHFKINPFWWQDFGATSNVTTEIIQLVIDGVALAPDPINVFLKEIGDPKVKEFSGKTNKPVVFEFNLAEKSLFTATFHLIDLEYTVSIGNNMPGGENLEEILHLIKKTELISVLSNTSLIYVSISPNTNRRTNYKYEVAAHECIYWASFDLSWKRDLCAIVNDHHSKKSNLTHCKCNHLSYFGGRTYIPDLIPRAKRDKNFRSFEIITDYTILAVVISFTLLFLILLYLAHRHDISFEGHNKVKHILDNVPGDKELYLLLVETGMSPGAGTSADVALKMYGTLGEGRVHLLSSEINQVLKRNNEVIFAVYAPKCVGHITKIQLWHNSNGPQPHWFCDRVIIKHPKSHNQYLFNIHRWFSLIYGDGSTKGTFYTAKEKVKFKWKLQESLRESHHILSIFSKRARPGTSKETVFICFASCATVMLAAILMFKSAEHKDITSIIVIGILSALASLPVTIILRWGFRNSH